MKYVHLGPDSICVLDPLHPDGLLQPMTYLGFSRTGLTYFAININLSLALQTVVTLLHNTTNTSFRGACDEESPEFKEMFRYAQHDEPIFVDEIKQHEFPPADNTPPLPSLPKQSWHFY